MRKNSLIILFCLILFLCSCPLLAQEQVIQSLPHAIVADNRKAVAKLVEYLFPQPYPLKPIQAGGVGNQHLPLALSVFLQQNLQTFGTRSLPLRRFLQHYYRDAVYRKPPKAHRCARDLLWCSRNL